MGKLELVTASNGQKFFTGFDKCPKRLYVAYFCFDKNKKEWIDEYGDYEDDIIPSLWEREDINLYYKEHFDPTWRNDPNHMRGNSAPFDDFDDDMDILIYGDDDDEAFDRLKYLRNIYKEWQNLDENHVLIDYNDKIEIVNRFTPMYEDDDFIYKIAIGVNVSTNNGVGYEGTVNDIYNAISMCENVDIDDIKQFAKELNCEPKEGDEEDVIANDTESILYYRDGKFELKWLGDDEDEQ